jgi:DNA-binding response OmpR family regulator
MYQHNQPTLLAVGVDGLPGQSSLLDIYTATTLREAMATIRLMCFDLVMVGLNNPTLDIWELMHRVLTAWPQQRWILTAAQISTEEEIRARSLGALMVLSNVPQEEWLADYAASLRQRDSLKAVYPLLPADTPMLAMRNEVSVESL